MKMSCEKGPILKKKSNNIKIENNTLLPLQTKLIILNNAMWKVETSLTFANKMILNNAM